MDEIADVPPRVDALLRRCARSTVDTLCSTLTPADDQRAVRCASAVPGYWARSRTRGATEVRVKDGSGPRRLDHDRRGPLRSDACRDDVRLHLCLCLCIRTCGVSRVRADAVAEHEGRAPHGVVVGRRPVDERCRRTSCRPPARSDPVGSGAESQRPAGNPRRAVPVPNCPCPGPAVRRALGVRGSAVRQASRSTSPEAICVAFASAAWAVSAVASTTPRRRRGVALGLPKNRTSMSGIA